MEESLFSNVLVVVTGSDASMVAVKYAIIMAKTYSCRLTAVYVVDTATIRQLRVNRIFIQEESQEYEKNLRAEGEQYLAQVEKLAQTKGVRIEGKIRQGAVYTEILNLAEEKKADLILLGCWEKDQNLRSILSYFYREIMVHAKCSVMLVKEPNIEHIFRQV